MQRMVSGSRVPMYLESLFGHGMKVIYLDKGLLWQVGLLVDVDLCRAPFSSCRYFGHETLCTNGNTFCLVRTINRATTDSAAQIEQPYIVLGSFADQGRLAQLLSTIAPAFHLQPGFVLFLVLEILL